jgi:hypothetical protein
MRVMTENPIQSAEPALPTMRVFMLRLFGSYVAGSAIASLLVMLPFVPRNGAEPLAGVPILMAISFVVSLPFLGLAVVLALAFKDHMVKNLLAWCLGAAVVVPVLFMLVVYWPNFKTEGLSFVPRSKDYVGIVVFIYAPAYMATFYAWNRIAESRARQDGR